MRTLLVILISTLLIQTNLAQNYFQGYSKMLSGKNFGYHSPLPGANTCLLLRGQADYEDIEWESEVIPANYNEEHVSLIWAFGMDVTSSPVDFTLHINGKPSIHFSSSRESKLGEMVYAGINNSQLTLNVTMLDKYEDQMGFAILEIPTTSISKGQPIQLKLSSETEDNSSWIMTYKTAVKKSIDIYQNKVVAKKDGNLFHSVSVDFIHIGDEIMAEVGIGKIKSKSLLTPGFNKMELLLPKVKDSTKLSATVKIGKEKSKIPFVLTPVREWEIYLVQHTHTDIGYTRPQTEILPEHLRYIDHALDFCDQTDHLPEAAQFRWTCETSWSVREYLKSRPQKQIDRLLQRIKEGRIEATGMFLNYSEIIDENALAVQTKTLKMLKNKGIDVTTAMQNDVNGIAWCLVDYYHNTDVKYLTMGIHAHRARKPFNKPTSFWWQSPSGNRLLAYRSEHYQHGNSLSLTTGQQDVFRNNLSDYLSSLEERDYPYDRVALQFSGYVTDNSPPSAKVCQIIADWNEKYEWPKLRSSLARDFLIWLDEYHKDDLPQKEVAWPDWWTDGVASAANETKETRLTQNRIAAVSSVMAMSKMSGNELPASYEEDLDEVYDNLLFYNEHTHGSSESVRDPLAQNTINQWNMKASYAWEASKKCHELEEKTLAFIESAFEGSEEASIIVFNTLNWTRSGLVELFIPNEVVAEGAPFIIVDDKNNSLAWEMNDQRMEGAYYSIWVNDMPPMGYKVLKVKEAESIISGDDSNDKAGENQWYRITLDDKNGIIKSIYDKELNIELLDQNDSISLGQVIYERLDNRHEMERLTSSTRDTIYKALGMKRSQLENITFGNWESGSIYSSLHIHGELPVCADDRGVDIEIRLYHQSKKIEFLYRLFKLPVVDPEGLYVSFPFQLDEGHLAFEAQGGIVRPGKNQLEGTSSDWNTIQNFAAVRNAQSQIVFVSDEIPLVQFGDINTGHYYYRLNPKSNHIYSWVLNNYWVTNFKASQEGELNWSYAITSANKQSNQYATQFGWGERVPILSRIIMPKHGAGPGQAESKSFLDLDVDNLLLVNSYPSLDGKGIILLVRELEGDHAILDIRRIQEESGATYISEVNIYEEEIKALNSPLLIEHYETKFIKLDFE